MVSKEQSKYHIVLNEIIPYEPYMLSLFSSHSDQSSYFSVLWILLDVSFQSVKIEIMTTELLWSNWGVVEMNGEKVFILGLVKYVNNVC